MTPKKAALELQSIRNDAAGMGDIDREALRNRCDAIGKWLASQPRTPKVASLLKEAHHTFIRINRGRC